MIMWPRMWMLALVLWALVSPAVYLANGSDGHEVHVVYLGGKRQEVQSTEIVADHHQLLASAVGSIEEAKEAILYHYHRSFRGFAAKLAPHHVQALSASDRVMSIFKSRSHKRSTTNSWDFVGVHGPRAVASGSSAKFPSFDVQSDVIIGVLDSGYWPESPSFNDQGLGPPPARWRGQCVAGENFTALACNNKVIGARYYSKGAEANLGRRIERDFYSPRDVDGHGSHTASTAAGREVANVSFFGIAPGTATGGAPGARLAIYKVCWAEGGCTDADVLAAYDDAIADGVDIVSFSVGTSTEVNRSILTDGFALGSLLGSLAGVLTSASASNSGPGPETVVNSAPWFLTAAASTTDRELISGLRLGNGVTIPGQWATNLIFNAEDTPLIVSTQAAKPGADAEMVKFCANDTLDASKFEGKILVCDWNYDLAIPVGNLSLVAGLVNILIGGNSSVANNFPGPVSPLARPITFSTEKSAQSILQYIQSTSAPVAQIQRTTAVYGFQPAPVVASFSSRGPSPRSPDIIKPDIIAPGVNILAAHSPLSSRFLFSANYALLSGTSMACPHITGIAALIKAVHPNWSPAIIKSAIMTTAYAVDNTNKSLRAYPDLEASADEYAFGSGHVNPVSALDPGLVYDTDPLSYIDFLCSLENVTTINAVFSQYQAQALYADAATPFVSCPAQPLQAFNLNYPSISVTNLARRQVVKRVVTNVGPLASVQYTAQVAAPRGVHVSVHPKELRFQEIGERLEFLVEITVTAQGSDIRRGSLTWSDGQGGHKVRSPIVVKTVTSS